MEPENHILTTRGITSEVRTEGGNVGHALLVDYDDDCGYDRVREETASLPGLSALYESSPGSWHLVNTTMRGRDAAATAMLSLKCDPTHISVGYRRGRWTLRVGPKTRENASAGPDVDDLDRPYKSAPEPLDWWVNSTEREQSAAHVNYVASTFPDPEVVAARARERCGPHVGEAMRIEAYRTMTDRLKEEVRDA